MDREKMEWLKLHQDYHLRTVLDSPKHKFYSDIRENISTRMSHQNSGTNLGVKMIHPRYPDQLGHKWRLRTLDTMFTLYNHMSKSWIPPTKLCWTLQNRSSEIRGNISTRMSHQDSGSVQWNILRSQGDSSSVSRSIRTQMKTSDTGYNVHGYNVHVIQLYVKILDSTHQVVLDSPKHKFRYTRKYFDQDVTSR